MTVLIKKVVFMKKREKMNDEEKRAFKQEYFTEVCEVIDEAIDGYMNIFQAGKMSFSEFTILENVLIKIQEGLRKRDLSD